MILVGNKYLKKLRGNKRIGVACGKHGFVKGEVCPACVKERGEVQKTAAVHIFKPMWAEHLESEPVYIKSKRHYKDECKKRNVSCAGLL